MNKHLLDIERLKRLEPIMEACGVEADVCLSRNNYLDTGSRALEQIPTYDHADLESVFTEKTWDTITYIGWSLEEKHIQRILQREPVWKNVLAEVIRLYKLISKLRGQAKLEVMCDLIILLWDNGIKLKGQK